MLITTAYKISGEPLKAKTLPRAVRPTHRTADVQAMIDAARDARDDVERAIAAREEAES